MTAEARLSSVAKPSAQVASPATHGIRQPPSAKAEPDKRHLLLERLLIWVLLGFASVCAILLVVMLQKARVIETAITRGAADIAVLKARTATIEARLSEFEKNEVPVTDASRGAADKQRRPLPLVLTETDEKTVGQFIKVPVAAAQGGQTVHLGDIVPSSATAPLPDSLVGQLPKLSGGRFMLDRDGAIVIFGRGSNRVDAIVGRR